MKTAAEDAASRKCRQWGCLWWSDLFGARDENLYPTGGQKVGEEG